MKRILFTWIFLLLSAVIGVAWYVSTNKPAESVTSEAAEWQTYTDEIEGYQFAYAPGYQLLSVPAEEGHWYGLFLSEEAGQACAQSTVPVFSDECVSAYYFLRLSAFDGIEWQKVQTSLVNVESYRDAQGREWTVSSIEAAGRMRVDGYLVDGSVWYNVHLEAPLAGKTYPAFLEEAAGLARKTFDSFATKK